MIKNIRERERRVVGIIIFLLLINIVYYGAVSSTSSTLTGKEATNITSESGSLAITASKYWAILICGSNDFNLGFETDIRDMYLLLKNVLGYNDNNIWYVAPSNWNQATHYYAISQANVQKAIQDVASSIAYEDCLYFYYTAHGSAQSLDGDGDKTPGEPEDVSAAELDSWLDGVNVKQMVIVLQGCNTGSFINTLTHSKRIIITATDAQTSAWEDMNGYGDPDWDPNAKNDDGASNPQNDNWDGSEFSSGFRMAFRDIDSDGYKEADENVYINKPGKTPDLTLPYGNKDVKISVQESFNFAQFEDYASPYWKTYVQQQGWQLEYPQLNYQDINPSITYIYMTNKPPNTPNTPSGITDGEINVEYTYTTNTTDPDDDQVYYWFDWGDGTNSGWVGPYPSGVIGSAKYTWTEQGTYEIKVKAKDIYGNESGWSDPLPITMPYSFYKVILQFLELLSQRFPNASPLLQQLLGY